MNLLNNNNVEIFYTWLRSYFLFVHDVVMIFWAPNFSSINLGLTPIIKAPLLVLVVCGNLVIFTSSHNITSAETRE